MIHKKQQRIYSEEMKEKSFTEVYLIKCMYSEYIHI